MKHLFIQYELALIAKEKGFARPCFGYYNNETKEISIIQYNKFHINDSEKHFPSAPLYQQIVDWLRENHKMDIHVKKEWHKGEMLGYESIIENNNGDLIDCAEEGATYYEALDTESN